MTLHDTKREAIMRTLDLILYVIAAVCFALAAVAADRIPRVNLLALALLAWVCVPLIATARD